MAVRWRFGAMMALSALGGCSHGRCGQDPSTKVKVVPKESPPLPTTTDCPAALSATRKGGADTRRYVVPTEPERAAVRAAMRALGAGARQDAETAAAKADFEIVEVPEMRDVLLVREEPSMRRGGGAYLVRLGSRSTLLVQAPHTFFDQGTLALGCELFQRAGARAFFIETAHRYKAAEKNEDGEDVADVAHQPTSLYQAATEGALDAAPGATVVQLHGFATREDDARVVLSRGVKTPGDPLVASAATALKEVLGAGVLRYPEEDGELGATTNAQGALVRARGGRFLHVEMDARLRRDLLADAAHRERVMMALARALGGS